MPSANGEKTECADGYRRPWTATLAIRRAPCKSPTTTPYPTESDKKKPRKNNQKVANFFRSITQRHWAADTALPPLHRNVRYINNEIGFYRSFITIIIIFFFHFFIFFYLIFYLFIIYYYYHQLFLIKFFIYLSFITIIIIFFIFSLFLFDLLSS